MQITTPLKEVTDIIQEAGGEELKLCYQCGLCTGVCPWNTVRSFLVRRIMHQAQLGLVDFEIAYCPWIRVILLRLRTLPNCFKRLSSKVRRF